MKSKTYVWPLSLPSSGEVTVDTCGSDFDTVTSINSQDGTLAFSESDTNDCGTNERVSFTAVADIPYPTVAVRWASTGSRGIVQVTLTCSTDPVASSSGDENDGGSGGAVAGAVVGILLAIAAGVGVAYLIRKRHRDGVDGTPKLPRRKSELPGYDCAVENAAYNPPDGQSTDADPVYAVPSEAAAGDNKAVYVAPNESAADIADADDDDGYLQVSGKTLVPATDPLPKVAPEQPAATTDVRANPLLKASPEQPPTATDAAANPPFPEAAPEQLAAATTDAAANPFPAALSDTADVSPFPTPSPPAIVTELGISEADVAIYDGLWSSSGKVDEALQAPAALVYFSRSGLDQQTLRTMWSVADSEPPKGQLNRDEFFRACKLIALAQSGIANLSLDIINTPVGLPEFQPAGETAV